MDSCSSRPALRDAFDTPRARVHRRARASARCGMSKFGGPSSCGGAHRCAPQHLNCDGSSCRKVADRHGHSWASESSSCAARINSCLTGELLLHVVHAASKAASHVLASSLPSEPNTTAAASFSTASVLLAATAALSASSNSLSSTCSPSNSTKDINQMLTQCCVIFCGPSGPRRSHPKSPLVILIYFFAIVFRQLTDDTSVGDDYFPSVLQGSGC